RRLGWSGWSAWWSRLREAAAEKRPGWKPAAAVAVLAAVAAAAFWQRRALRQWWRLASGRRKLRQGAATPHDAAVLYERMLARLRRLGFEKTPWMTPAEFAACLPQGEPGDTVRGFTACYHRFRYGASPGA